MAIQIIGYLLNWGLFGTLSIQLYLYYLAFPKDRPCVKSLVYGIYIAELVQTILVAHDAFTVFAYGFGDWEALVEIHFNWLVVPIMTAIVAFAGQCFYAYRIFILSRSRIIPAFVICVSLASSVPAIIAGVYVFQSEDLTKINNLRISIYMGISCGGSALCDIVIAICMTHYLMRSNTAFRSTQILITKIIRLTIETGSMTAVVVLANFILFVAFPHQAFYYIPSMIESKVYANAIYMIMGGRETYTSSTDIEITSTMMRDITFHSTQGGQRTPVVAMTEEEKPQDDNMSLLA
ncbi:hypothetical protein EDD18DRAFT_1332954 [Armillaria luteobubalina]|uniref:DUF6534 domain-containing protein n=1 Tax=Armillaria luteobubalina TaxID=153913 RepID=A0AA39UVU7_9AGAR|nr:hypothetical protein EDD18DRAFT_1332954 [Armillaria luteobubalina]